MATGTANNGTYYRQGLDQEQSPQEPPPQRVKRKRNRVPVACFNCRALKTKCDGGKPACATCTASGENCQYSVQGIAPSAATVMVNQE
jgi:hypothetical protein